jgi:hypothetical protein
MANFNKTVGKRRADTMSIEYSMQQLGLLLPAAALTVNGGWPQRCWRAMADRDENMHGPLVKTTDGNARRNVRRFATGMTC